MLVAFAVVAWLTCGDQVARVVGPTVCAGDDVVYLCGFGTAVPANIVVALEDACTYFTPCSTVA